jgi:putative transposase
VVFPADRGCQYTSGEDATLADDLAVILSSGRTRAVLGQRTRRVILRLPERRVPRPAALATRAAARRATVEYIAWYNGTRLLSALGYMTPDEFETTPKEAPTQVA